MLAFRPAADGTTTLRRAPLFETNDLEGRRVRLADHRGEVVVLNFWASWCIPCRAEFPLLEEVHGREATVLGVVFNDSRRAAARFMREQGATWPGLVDPDGDIAAAYAVRMRPGIPVTIVVDGDGRIVARHDGELRRADLRRLLAAAR